MPIQNWVDSRSIDGSRRSGDFAECFALQPRRQAIVVGDVAGKGSAAGPAADALRDYVRTMVLCRAPLGSMLRAADEFFVRTLANEDMPFATLFVAIADAARQHVTYVSAGHETALLFRGDVEHEHLESTGPVLGLAVPAGKNGRQRVLRFYEDSLLVVVTDGITEARAARGGDSFFGSHGVARAVREARAQRRNPAQAIYEAARRHARGALTGDASVVVSRLGTRAGRQPLPAVAPRHFG